MQSLSTLTSLLLAGLLAAVATGAVPASKARVASGSGSIEVVTVEGDARLRNRPLAAGAALAAGDELRAGNTGHVRLKLVDGSTVSFWGPGSIVFDRVQALPSAKAAATSLRLDHGRIEVTVRAQKHAEPRLEVRTPIAVAMTRGALFRLSAVQSQSMTCEVDEGSVQIADSANLGNVAVTRGSGTRVVAGRAPMKPVRLLPAPHLWTGIQLVEQKRLEIPFTPLEGANAYRMIVSPGGDLYRRVADEVFQVPRLRISNVADGDYFVKVRAIDEFGIEGAGTILRMKVYVRPDPPSPTLPPERGRLFGQSAELAWLPDPDAIGYVAQLAADDVFRSRLQEWDSLREPKVLAEKLPPGSYHWRVASVLKDRVQSRFSAVRSFRLDPPPAPPPAPKLEGEMLRFAWNGKPGEIFVLQVAADPRFEHLVEERHTNQPAAELPRPLQGVYFARLRTTQRDGTIEPYTAATRFEVRGKAPGTQCLVEGERGLCAVYAPAR